MSPAAMSLPRIGVEVRGAPRTDSIRVQSCGALRKGAAATGIIHDNPARSNAPLARAAGTGIILVNPARSDRDGQSSSRNESPRRAMRPSTRPPSTDARIDAIAAEQHGVVSRRQLVAAGVVGHAIDDRLRKGRLEGVYRGVYRVGPVRARWWREVAAVLACGGGAVVSHWSAGRLAGLLRPGAGAEGPVHVTIPSGYRTPGPGAKVHRASVLSSDETTTLHGIPCTTPARTILDLSGVLAPRALERVVARALRDGAVDTDAIARLVGRHPRRAGAGVLRRLLAQETEPAFTRSAAEERFLRLVRRSGLPVPRSNVRLNGVEVDFHWPSTGLVVEVDGYAFHGSRVAFEHDHGRDAALTVAGYRVLRFTWRQLTRQPEKVLVAVTRALAGRDL